MTRQSADFRYPAPAPWRFKDTVIVVLASAVAVSAFAGLVLLWFMMHPTGTLH
jgi:hypothetical protein